MRLLAWIKREREGRREGKIGKERGRGRKVYVIEAGFITNALGYTHTRAPRSFFDKIAQGQLKPRRVIFVANQHKKRLPFADDWMGVPYEIVRFWEVRFPFWL